MTTETLHKRYRSVFLGDVHLGSPHSQADKLLSFLENANFDLLCIVGDLFDDLGIALPELHQKVVQFVLKLLQDGTKVIYVPGNHDALFRGFIGDYGNLTITNHYVHSTVDGTTIAVIHGDQFDIFKSTRTLHLIDRLLPTPFWELLRRLFTRLMDRHINAFERKILEAFVEFDKVLCGHIHQPLIRGNYINVGDFIKNCTVVVEHEDGYLELVYT